jgi:hypothetical protein
MYIADSNKSPVKATLNCRLKAAVMYSCRHNKAKIAFLASENGSL